MHVTKVNITDFYNSKIVLSFPVIMCLVSRRGDLPNIDQHLSKLWHSFDSLTNDKILFVFGNNSNESQNVIKNIHGQSTKFEFPQILYNRKHTEKFSQVFVNDFFQKNYRKYNVLSENWYLGHELQINEIVNFFDLSEADIPCLHLTFLSHGFEYIIKLKKTDKYLYSVVKGILEVLEVVNYESMLDEIHRYSKATSALLEKKKLLESDKYYSSLSYLKNIIENGEIPQNCHNSLNSILVKDHCKEIVMREHIRFLKKSLDRKIYKIIIEYITIIYDSIYHEKWDITNYDEQRNKIKKINDQILLVNNEFKLKLQQDKNELINKLNLVCNRSISKNGKITMIKKLTDCLEIKPNIMGLGINFNEIINLVLKKNT